jgi:hypothetical protein
MVTEDNLENSVWPEYWGLRGAWATLEDAVTRIPPGTRSLIPGQKGIARLDPRSP